MQADLLRYSCQLALPGFGTIAQQKLKDAKVLVVGAGGLGCPAAQYLAAAGIGHLTIVDDDTVSTGNLHRQILFNPADAGLKKAEVAAKRLSQQNPDITVIPLVARVNETNVMQLVESCDMVIDCTDNFETRYLLNDACVLAGKPLVYGAIYQYEGQVAVWNVENAAGARSPNYRDLFPDVNASQIPNCAEGGVLPTLAGIIGCMQANEAIKYFAQTGDLLAGKVLIFDVQTMQSRIIKLGAVSHTIISNVTATIHAPVMSVEEVRNGLANHLLELVDIRTDQERDVIDIGGTHIEADELDDHADWLNNGSVKVLYCSSGKRSGEAVKLIRQKYPSSKVYSLEGGLGKWFANDKENPL